MKPKTLGKIVNRLNSKGYEINSRIDIENMIWDLAEALEDTSHDHIIRNLKSLYEEIDAIDTYDLIKAEVFI